MKPLRRANGFYDTPAWRALRKVALIRDSYRCRICGRAISGKGEARVDHIKPVATHPHLVLSLDNLRSLCTLHDQQRHRDKSRKYGLPTPERFTITGCDVNGEPLDPNHRWKS